MDLGISRPRSAALLVGTTALLLVGLRWALGPTSAPADRFANGLERGAAWLLVAAAAWLSVVATALLAEACCGARSAALRWCPAPETLRRLVAISSGAALSVGLAAPALATAEAPSVEAHSSIDGLRLPGMPLTATPPPDVVHRVVRGDTLWAIAAEQVPGARPAEVAALVDRIHTDNREVIGADPDRLLPGQILRVTQDPR